MITNQRQHNERAQTPIYLVKPETIDIFICLKSAPNFFSIIKIYTAFKFPIVISICTYHILCIVIVVLLWLAIKSSLNTTFVKI